MNVILSLNPQSSSVASSSILDGIIEKVQLLEDELTKLRAENAVITASLVDD